METQLMFLDCPAYLDEEGRERCGLPAEVRSRFTMNSTGGPLESLTLATEPGDAALPCLTDEGSGRTEWPS